MNDPKPWFVKITGPMRWQVKPYGWQGWAIMGIWMLLLWGIMALMFMEAMRELVWVAPVLSLAITAPFVLLAIRTAVPIEEVRDRRRPSARGRRRGR